MVEMEDSVVTGFGK